MFLRGVAVRQPPVTSGGDAGAFAVAVGRVLRERREVRAIAGRDVARAAGISQPVYARIEAGEAEVRLVTAVRICEALAWDVSGLLRAVAGRPVEG